MKRMDKSIVKSPPLRNYKKSELTPAKKKFAQVFARTDNATEAVRQAYPEANSSNESLAVKAHRLLRNDNVSMEVEYQKNKLEQLASKAVNRVEKLLDSDNEIVATTNVWKTIEQVQGRATQRTENQSTVVNLNLSLSDVIEDTPHIA